MPCYLGRLKHQTVKKKKRTNKENQKYVKIENINRIFISNFRKLMKIITLLFSLFLFSYSSLFSQRLSIGLEAGISSSRNTKYEFSTSENRRTSFNAGINLNYAISQTLSINSGLHYLRQGYTHETCYIFPEGVENKLVGKFDYLMIPLAANIHLLKSKKLVVNFGINGAYNVKAAQDHPEALGGCSIGYIRNLKNTTKDFNLIGSTGIGYKIFQNVKNELLLMMKYYHGLANYNNTDYKNNSFLVNMVYNFRI